MNKPMINKLYIGDDGYDDFDDEEGDYEYGSDEVNYSIIMNFKFIKNHHKEKNLHFYQIEILKKVLSMII